MLLIVLALLWVAILVPIAVRRFRDDNTERSIESFHAEREVLSRQEVAHAPPAYDDRLVTSRFEDRAASRPRLTVVHDDDTYGSLEARGSWDEWNRNYDYEHDAGARKRDELNRYAAAYSTLQGESFDARFDAPYYERPSMKVRRRRIAATLVVLGGVLTGLSVVTKSSMVEDAAIAAWIALVAYVALGLVALGFGYLRVPRFFSGRTRAYEDAPIEPLYRDAYADYEAYDDDRGTPQWARESTPRRALG